MVFNFGPTNPPMKKIILFLLLLSSCLLRAQDSIFIKSGRVLLGQVVEVNQENVLFKPAKRLKGPPINVPRRKVVKIVYRTGLTESYIKIKPQEPYMPYRDLINKHFDSSFVKKNFLRLYMTDIFLCKLSIGYERILSQKYSFEVDAFCKFPFDNSDFRNAYEEDWKRKLIFQSQGWEIRIGASRHLILGDGRFSVGLSLSYREQSFSNQYLVPMYPRGSYFLDQKKKGAGLFLKLNFQPLPQHSGFEIFAMIGGYVGTTKNHYNWYQSNDYPYPVTTDPAKIPKITNNYMKDGFSILPYFNAGFSFIIKAPQKAWYKELNQKREALKIHGRNVLLFNTIELIDGAVGLTYMRISYKHAFDVYGSAAIGTNTWSFLSNASLQEKNLNYSLNIKNFDFLASANYHLIGRRQSFPFIGFLVRGAQFVGQAYTQAFLLNKYYGYLNFGYIARKKGFSLMLNVAPGFYNNHYLSPDPHFTPNNSGSAIYASVQIGCSF